MRNIFLSYEFRHDAWKAQAIRSVWLASGGTVTLEAEEAGSDWQIKQWIDHTLRQAEVTVVLVGPNTASSRWVEYEVQLSKSLGKGLLGIDVVGMSGRGNVSPGPQCQCSRATPCSTGSRMTANAGSVRGYRRPTINGSWTAPKRPRSHHRWSLLRNALDTDGPAATIRTRLSINPSRCQAGRRARSRRGLLPRTGRRQP